VPSENGQRAQGSQPVQNVVPTRFRCPCTTVTNGVEGVVRGHARRIRLATPWFPLLPVCGDHLPWATPCCFPSTCILTPRWPTVFHRCQRGTRVSLDVEVVLTSLRPVRGRFARATAPPASGPRPRGRSANAGSGQVAGRWPSARTWAGVVGEHGLEVVGEHGLEVVGEHGLEVVGEHGLESEHGMCGRGRAFLWMSVSSRAAQYRRQEAADAQIPRQGLWRSPVQ